jgi:hypothetical protein
MKKHEFDYHALMSNLDEFAAYLDYLQRKGKMSKKTVEEITTHIDAVQNTAEMLQ